MQSVVPTKTALLALLNAASWPGNATHDQVGGPNGDVMTRAAPRNSFTSRRCRASRNPRPSSGWGPLPRWMRITAFVSTSMLCRPAMMSNHGDACVGVVFRAAVGARHVSQSGGDTGGRERPVAEPVGRGGSRGDADERRGIRTRGLFVSKWTRPFMAACSPHRPKGGRRSD
jgi:hypothetical protein